MEWEKIVYYYPMWEQQEKVKNRCAAKRYWFQEAVLGMQNLSAGKEGELRGAQDGGNVRLKESTKIARHPEFDVIACAVPPFYYRCRPWKPQILSETMEGVLRRVEGMADTWLHPQIGELLTKEYERRWIPRRETVQMMTVWLIERYAARLINECGKVVVLLGETVDTDWQMKMTRDLLLPYLPKINKLLIFYEEVAETDIWMELGSHLDEYYYEYGLVPQMEPYIENHIRGQDGSWSEMPVTPYPDTTHGLRCGKPKCDGLILDYSGNFRYPKIMPDSKAVYIDVMSNGEKERLLGRKTPCIPYVSPLKYLDTMVKNSYDR